MDTTRTALRHKPKDSPRPVFGRKYDKRYRRRHRCRDVLPMLSTPIHVPKSHDGNGGQDDTKDTGASGTAKWTLDYLVNEVVAKGNNLRASHTFIQDRFRSIRLDLAWQNSRGLEAVQVHEVMARYHILCVHQLCGLPEFNVAQEVKQLQQVLTCLRELYGHMRKEGSVCSNEPEFQAYILLMRVQEPDLMDYAQDLPSWVLQQPNVQAAIEVYNLMRQCEDNLECQHNNDLANHANNSNNNNNNNNSAHLKVLLDPFTIYRQLFERIFSGEGILYLMACMLEMHFAHIRKGALKLFGTTYAGNSVLARDLVRVLGYDNTQECIADSMWYGVRVLNDSPALIVFKAQNNHQTYIDSRPLMTQHRSQRLVEAKRGCFSEREIILGHSTTGGVGGGYINDKKMATVTTSTSRHEKEDEDDAMSHKRPCVRVDKTITDEVVARFVKELERLENSLNERYHIWKDAGAIIKTCAE
ncbi:hypothetical protein BG004_004463 [Podila humilis]|nr:hypothetical protein BG004_004463 [Podila humilis]